MLSNGDYETLRNQQRKLEKDITALEDNSLKMCNKIDAIQEYMNEHMQYFRSTLQKHIDSRIAHNASIDMLDTMFDLVREGKASMTVSYNLYPVEKGEGNNDT